jgi:hypothetical protein
MVSREDVEADRRLLSDDTRELEAGVSESNAHGSSFTRSNSDRVCNGVLKIK